LNEEKPIAWYNADDSSLSFKNHGGGWQPLYEHTNEQAVITAFERGRAFGYAEGLKKVQNK